MTNPERKAERFGANPFKSVGFSSLDRTPVRPASPEEVQLFLDVAPTNLRDVMLLMMESGQRPQKAVPR
jgi:hypothetical protein